MISEFCLPIFCSLNFNVEDFATVVCFSSQLDNIFMKLHESTLNFLLKEIESFLSRFLAFNNSDLDDFGDRYLIVVNRNYSNNVYNYY